MKENKHSHDKVEQQQGCDDGAIINADYYAKEIKRRQNHFLDTYNFYKQHKSDMHKKLLERSVIELELIDPTFSFRID